MSVKVKNADGTWSQVGGMMKPGFQDITGNPSDNANLNAALNAKSTVSVSATGTATDTVSYITVDGVEKKLAGGGGGGSVTDVQVSQDGTTYSSVLDGTVGKINLSDKALKTTKVNNHPISSDVVVNGAEIKLDGYTQASAASYIETTDTVNDALGKLEFEIITASNVLTNHKNDNVRHVNATDKSNWNAKYNKPLGGIPKTDLAADIQTSLGLADTALQAHQDISGKANTSDLTAHTGNTSNPHSVTASQIGLGNVENKSAATILGELTSSQITAALGFTPFDNAKLGASNGAAQLGSDGIVPASQLPSYLDEIVEVSDYAHLPATGLTNKIYRTLDNYKSYRWGGTAYTEIPASLSLGETSSTAYAGDKGKIAYDHSQIAGGTGVHISDAERTSWTAKLTHAGTANNISLPTTGWTSNSITVTCTGMTSTANFIVGPAPASHDDYSECGIICSAQGTDSLTFTRKKANANAIAVNLYIFG